jgi:RHS repeat-associated protein
MERSCALLLLLFALPTQAAVQMYYLHNDHLGTPRVVTSQAREVVWKGQLKPFGETSVEVEAITNHRRLPGQRFDIESRLYYNYFRDYDPTTGRYMQSDPIGLTGGLNTYAYVGNNPLMHGDLYGLARFGFRPLAGDDIYYISHFIPDGSGNHHRAHEQLWFDDNPNENVGFFAGDGNAAGPAICGEDGDVRIDNGHSRFEYDFIGPVYDDNLMRQALAHIRNNWDDKIYCLAGRNCQHFSDALRKEYSKLESSSSCRLTRRGMVCN